ncbi:MAG: replicative DNA helicase, partial [Campylobacteraceae bacterium]|nr:replicative DNA helicase [Campylobacteraceae bacterium]
MDNLYNINIERAVLSSIIFNSAIFEDVVTILKPEDFYLPAHKNIFHGMTKCFHDELPIDEEFLKKVLNADGLFDENVMLDVLSTNPLQSIGAYINEIKEKSIKRELVRLTGDINDLAVEKDLPAKDVLDMIQQKLYKITSETSSRDFRDSFEIAHSTIDYIKEMKKRGNSVLVGLDTGFYELNKLSTGFN